MRVIQCSSLSDAYYKGVKYILDRGVIKHIHDVDVLQANECALEIKVDNNNDWSELAPFGEQSNNEYVNNFLNPYKGDFTYTYGERICNYNSYNQLDAAIKTLQTEKLSRQSVIVIWNPKTDNDMSDCPCLQHIQFYFGDKDNFTMKVLFRSNDWYGALLSNLNGLKSVFKLVGSKIDAEPKRLILDANCPHIYWHNVDECRKKWSIVDM
jgi:thymidylate synthase (methanogen type)